MSANNKTTSSEHDSTLDAHLQSIATLLHDLHAAQKKGTLQPESMAAALQQVYHNFTRDYPPELASSITESSLEDLLSGYWQRAQVRKIAAPTGLGGLDKALNGGFQAKRLVTLLGAPGGGKTSLANQWAEQIADKRPVMYVTSEDSADVLLSKTLARIGNIDYSAVLYGWENRRADINRAMEMLAYRESARNLRYLDVSSGMITLDELRTRAAAHFEGKPGPGLIVVDYLQRMARAIRESAGVKELREAVTALTERLRALACELDCTVLVIASMNRASGYGRSSDTNSLSSAKESGDIEYTADVMMALTEDNSNNKRITASFIEPRILKIDKNRQGPVTTLKLDWRADRQSFTEAGHE